MRSSRLFLLATLLGAAVVAACSGDEIPAPGSIMVSITTDMQARKDIDHVGLIVTSEGKVLFDEVAEIAPTIYFPTTTSLIGSRTSAKPVHIRVYAFQGTSARVLRQAITTIPTDRSALLQLPIEWVNDGSASGTLPAGSLLRDVIDAKEGDFDARSAPSVLSKCAAGETSIDGACASAAVDSSTLPAYSEGAVFGGGTAQSASCYDVTTCFATPSTVALDDACEGNAPGASSFAAKFPSGGDGQCVTGPNSGCYVPLSSAVVANIGNGRVRLAPGLCQKRSAAAADNRFELVASSACAPHDPAVQVCGDAAREGSRPNSFLDGGVINIEAGSSGDAQPSGDGGTSLDGSNGNAFTAPATFPPDTECVRPEKLTVVDNMLIYSCDQGDSVYTLRYRSTVGPPFAAPAPLTDNLGGRVISLAANPATGVVTYTDGIKLGSVSTKSPGGHSTLLTNTFNPSLAMAGDNVYFSTLPSGAITYCFAPACSPVPYTSGPDGGGGFYSNAQTLTKAGELYSVAPIGQLNRCTAPFTCSVSASFVGSTFPGAILANTQHVYWYIVDGSTASVFRVTPGAGNLPIDTIVSNLPRANFPQVDGGAPPAEPPFALDDKFVYYVSGHAVMASPTGGPPQSSTTITVLSDGNITALQSDGAAIYWVDATTASIQYARIR